MLKLPEIRTYPECFHRQDLDGLTPLHHHLLPFAKNMEDLPGIVSFTESMHIHPIYFHIISIYIYILRGKSRWLRILSCAIYVKKKKWGIDGSTPFKTGQLSHLSLKMTHVLQSSALVSPHFFSQHQAAFLGHRWRNSRGCAIYVGIPSLILAK